MAALLALGPLVGCSPVEPESEGLSGTVVVDGSSTVTPLVRAVSDELVDRVEPGVTVELKTSGTTAGLARLCAAEADVAMASRAITDEELAACEAAGVEAVEVPVGQDAVTVVVPRRNDYVGCLTTDELARLWGGTDVLTWQDLREAWPATALVLFAPGEGSGTAATFGADVLDGAAPRADVATSEDDEVLVQGVARSPGGLGYVPLGYARAAEDQVRAVALDAGDGCVEPDAGTVSDRTYPLSRTLQVYVSVQAYADEPAVAALVDLLVMREADAAEEVLVVPPSAEQQQEAGRALELLGG